MPKIDAASVAEHHAQVDARILDAAERIMRAGETLTARAVSSAAGIARNSIYRYVGSVDELRERVVARHLPVWLAAVEDAMSHAVTPEGRIVAWVDSNLALASAGGHSWLQDAAESRGGEGDGASEAHSRVREPLQAAWRELVSDGEAEIAASLTFGLLNAGMGLVQAGSPPDDVRRVARQLAQGMAAAARA